MADIVKYANHLLKKIKKLSEETIDHPVEVNIHSFRVEVKKLKALVHLISWYFPELDKKKLKKLWKLFDIAGTVREWQILAVQIGDFPLTKEVSEEMLKLIRHEEKKAYKSFQRNHKKSGPAYISEIGEYLHEFAERLSRVNLYGYFTWLTEKIQNKRNPENPSNQTYHKLRRDIKELKYNLKILDSEERSSMRFFTGSEFLHQCEELLGKWHDGVMATSQIQSLIIKGELTADTQRELNKILKSITQIATQWFAKFNAYYLTKSI